MCGARSHLTPISTAHSPPQRSYPRLVPEGDTIHRAARSLDRALAGKPLVALSVRAPGTLPPPGTVVDRVEARGKHCLIRFDDGSAIRTHLGMPGSWHLYRPGERWRKTPGKARVVLEAGEGDDAWVAVCFAAPQVEVLSPAEVASNVGTAHLGPDLCGPDPDVDEALRRMGTVDPGTTIGEVLLDQRVAAGVGNVYKCEVCFAHRLDPATPLAAVGEDERRELLVTAAGMLRANLDTNARTTTPDGGVAVYGHGGRPCPRCGATIRVERQGRQARFTWWCPACQVGRGEPGAWSSGGTPC